MRNAGGTCTGARAWRMVLALAFSISTAASPWAPGANSSKMSISNPACEYTTSPTRATTSGDAVWPAPETKVYASVLVPSAATPLQLATDTPRRATESGRESARQNEVELSGALPLGGSAHHCRGVRVCVCVCTLNFVLQDRLPVQQSVRSNSSHGPSLVEVGPHLADFSQT